MEFRNLFEKITIGNIEIKNRIVLSPMGIGAYSEDEGVADEYVSFIEARSRDMGLIITTGVRVSSQYGGFKFMGCYEDSHIPGFLRLTDTAHRAGSKIFLQILELGGADPVTPWVPSVDAPLYSEEWQGDEPPRELSTAQIRDIIEAFARAAHRAQEAGFDGVELGGAENFLVSDFICPYTNRRGDEFGGNFENRMRFPVEIVRAIKSLCGKDFPVGFKFNAFYHLPEGIDLDLGVRIAARMVEAGASYIHEWSFAKLDRPMSLFEYPPMPNLYQPRNTTVPIAHYLKSRISQVPIIAVGGILKPEEADRIIEEGQADMIAIGRACIADHEWAYKAKRGLRIRPCIRCHVCHHEVAMLGNLIACSINPDVLVQKPPLRTDHAKAVMVIGAGPGGITAALTAAQRGHHVNLYEKEGEIGGKLIPGSAPDFKHEFHDLLTYMQKAVEESSVDLVTNCEVTHELIDQRKPDVLVIATGAVQHEVDIPGIMDARKYAATEALTHADRIRDKRIVVIGGGDVGCETALLLLRKGNEVTIIEMLSSLMETEEIEYNTAVLERMLREEGVLVMTDAKVEEVARDRVFVRKGDGNKHTLQADLIVLCTGYRATPKEVQGLKDRCRDAHALGDCVAPGRLKEAISEGYRIGCLI